MRQKIHHSFIRIGAAVFAGCLAGFLALPFASGPPEGFFYDSLMEKRPLPRISPSLLLIDTAQDGETDKALDPMILVSALSVLTEMNAASLLVQAPVLGVSVGPETDARELLSRFEDEFTAIEENVRGLFDAVKTGSVPPRETERYVEEVLGLIEKSKSRLLADFAGKEKAGAESLAEAAETFGRVWIAADGWVPVYSGRDRAGTSAPAEEAARPKTREWYSHVPPDRDGRLRRIAPVNYSEGNALDYIAFAALRSYLGAGEVERNDMGLVLHTEKGGEDFFIALDKRGDMLLDIPPPEFFSGFPMSSLLFYDELDRALYRAVLDMYRRGYLDRLAPERCPHFLWEFAEDSRHGGDAGEKEVWKNMRLRYMESLEELFDGSVETALVTAYETMIAEREIGESGKKELEILRNKLIADFDEARRLYMEFRNIRSELSENLDGAFCVLGPASRASEGMTRLWEPGAAEASLVFANTILSRAAIRSAEDIQLVCWALVTALVTALMVRRLGAIAALFAGVLVSVLAASAAALAFIMSDYWINPVFPALVVLAAAAASSAARLCIKRISPEAI